MKYIIAHDLGTSGNKATLFSEDGALQLVRINNDGSMQDLRETFVKPEA